MPSDPNEGREAIRTGMSDDTLSSCSPSIAQRSCRLSSDVLMLKGDGLTLQPARVQPAPPPMTKKPNWHHVTLVRRMLAPLTIMQRRGVVVDALVWAREDGNGLATWGSG